jgi:hypothetical protein
MPCACQVTLQDLDGVEHTVRVEADWVYEAACLAIRALRKAGFERIGADRSEPAPERVYYPNPSKHKEISRH